MSDGTVLTFAQNDGSTSPKYYDGTKGIRMYAKNSMNVKASGKTIVGVVLNCDYYNGVYYVGNELLNGKTATQTVTPTKSETLVTFKGFSSNEFLITNDHTEAKGGVQLRIKTVTVYYAE